jgi:hypothetical protein
MKKLSKEDEDMHSGLVRELSNARDAVEEAVEAFNANMRREYELVADAAEKYDQAAAAADAFREQVASDIENYYDDKSEGWQEGEAGQQYRLWLEEWADLEVLSLEIDSPEPLDAPEFDEQFGDLPLSVDAI